MMKHLTTTICLTIALLLGSVGDGQTAFLDCKMDNNSSVKIMYDGDSNETHYFSVVDGQGEFVPEYSFIVPIHSIGQIIYQGKTQRFYVNQLGSENMNLVGYFRDPYDRERVLSLVVAFEFEEDSHERPIRILVPTPSGKVLTGYCETEF